VLSALDDAAPDDPKIRDPEVWREVFEELERILR
jgi:hypothetical protein